MKRILVVDDDRVTRHLLRRVLTKEGFAVATAPDGAQALRQMQKKKFALLLLDIWMPRLNGLEVLAELRKTGAHPRVIVMTTDTTPETVLRAVREQAYQYLNKPINVKALVELVHGALAATPAVPPIEVLSGRPEWVELLVPCELAAADRIQSFLSRLAPDLTADVRQSVGDAFRELLLNAIEWGGRLDPNRKARIACVRARHMLMYRIADPGPGFRWEELKHAAVSHPADQPFNHVVVREEKGLRPGGFGILMARAMVDALVYNEARNEVLFVKYIPEPASATQSSEASQPANSA